MKKLLILSCFILSQTFAVEQKVTMSIPSLDLISISGDPSTLTLAKAGAGEDPEPVSDSSTYYSITCNGENRTIKVSLDEDMPEHVTLEIEAEAPVGAESKGKKKLDVTPKEIVKGISNVSESNLTITYTLSATAKAQANSNLLRTVTWTLSED